MENIFSDTTEPSNIEDNAMFQLKQAFMDDYKDEDLALGTLLYRYNYLLRLIAQRKKCSDKRSELYTSLKISIKRERDYILTLVKDYYQMRTKHFENQHMLFAKVVKSFKKMG